MTRTMQELIDDAIEEFKERLEEYPEGFYQGEPHDVIHEIADSNVPVYNSDLLAIAADDNDVALNTPELGPAFDGTPTPINIIAANIYEKIDEALWEYWNDHEDEIKNPEEPESETELKEEAKP